MADLAYKNENGEIEAVNIYMNEDDAIKRPDDVFFNINNEVIRFPALDQCVLNLDDLTWVRGNEVFNASSFLDPNTNRIKIFDFNQEANFGQIKDNQTAVGSSQNFFINRKERFMARGSNKGRNKIQLLDKSVKGSDGSFTFSISFNTTFNNQWMRLFAFRGNGDNIRVEFSNNSNPKTFIFASNKANSNLSFEFSQAQVNAGYINITIVIDAPNNKFKLYKNGRYVADRNITRPLNDSSYYREIDFLSGYDDNTARNCVNGKIKSMRAWQKALTASEIMDICKIDGTTA